MRRQRFRKPTVSLALFPFLAVLVCTMGALIVLLVLVVQQARVSVAAEPVEVAVTPPPPDDDRQQQADAFDWRRKILERQRTELTAKLADSRLRLGHLEDHIRSLQEKWAQLQVAAEELDDLRSGKERAQADTALEQQRLQRAIAEARQELETLREEFNRRPRAFAIIPYAGPNGTKRRPIYIECTAQGIIIQPEGVVLRASDFDGPLGPGNPLDAALRATRTHLNRLGTTGTEGEPYPLLVVRPDGAIAYNVARMAMKAWDDEFGYELIDAEMQLKFPEPDPHLKQLLEQTVREARDRQSALAAAMPSQFQGSGTGGGGGFVASGSGGFVPQGSGFNGPGSGGSGSSTSNLSRGGRFTSFSNAPGQDARRQDAGGSAANPNNGASRSGQHVPDGGPEASANSAGGGAVMSVSPAQSRGKNWALPSSAANATAVTRPVRVVCFPDRLEIRPTHGEAGPLRVIWLGNGVEASLDEFVGAVWQHVEQWGIAVAGGYWKPTLQLVAAPGGDSTANRLQTLLNNSGLNLQRIR